MDVLLTHKQVVEDYASYIQSFLNIADPAIRSTVESKLAEGRLWPEPLLQFNPAYESAGTVEAVAAKGILHPAIPDILKGYSLYKHQVDAIKLGTGDRDFIVTSGTGSGKSLTYIGTIFHDLLRHPSEGGIRAVIVYPMNALINSQFEEFKRYQENYEKATGKAFPISFGQYTGQEKEEVRERMRENPPHVLLTNYMMLELLLTRTAERRIRDSVYLDLRAFTEKRQSKPKLDAAMALLADTEALIIDLRHNGGGYPQTVAYLSSFFLKPRVHLNDVVWRTAWGESRESFHTERVGLQYDKPVWLLISPRSFSAAEGFAYNLQQLQRVQIAGQPSGGGAHPGGMHKIGAHFSLFVPNGRSVNPTTGGNWEGVGVQPDVLLPAHDDALRVAQLRLLEHIKTQGSPNLDPRYQRGLEARIQELQAAAPKP